MGILTAYRGVVEKNGLVRLRRSADVRLLPPGSEVLVVATQPPPILDLDEQERRLAALSPEEWRRPFEAYEAIAARELADADIADISDDELVALIHEVR